MRRALVATASLLLLVPTAGAETRSSHDQRDREILSARSAAAAAWADMSPRARRAATRRELDGRRQRFAQARAAAPGAAQAVGRWARPFTISERYRGYAIHAALLRTGKVLFYGYPLRPEHPGFRGNETYAWLWNPARGRGKRAFKDVTVRDRDGRIVSVYCSGMSFLPDGRLLIVGGNKVWPDAKPDDEYTDFAGLNRAFLFDPGSERWTEVPRPPGSRGRWYPGQVMFPDGRTLVIAGLTDEAPGGIHNEDLEVYNPPTAANPLGSFELLTGPAQRRKTEPYPHLFVLPDGQVALAGPDLTDHALFDPGSLQAPWTELGRQTIQRIGGNSVLLPRGPRGSYEVLQIAGEPYNQRPLDTTERTDFSRAIPTWRSGPELHIRRSYPNTVLLPNRGLVVVGGIDKGRNYTPRGRQIELLGRGSNTFRLGPAQTEDRGYHSTALLLPDGRVLSAGDDLNPTRNGSYKQSSPFDTAEIYSPPYLFRGSRPAIRRAPRAIRYAGRFRVSTRSSVASALLAAPSAVTHGADMTQRLVPLRVAGRRR
ncbi:MAG: hypothetical protein QOJ22_366, partial [Thermoleophilaceae bacterium]|nr:hypothetical protein [Thermoleophilaceae bacterium]